MVLTGSVFNSFLQALESSFWDTAAKYKFQYEPEHKASKQCTTPGSAIFAVMASNKLCLLVLGKQLS